MNKFQSILFLLVASFLILVATPSAFADSVKVSVTVDGYDGRWRVEGTNHIGDDDIFLEPGSYNFNLLNVDSNYFQFSVDASGNVIVDDTDKATGGFKTLELTTHDVLVDVSEYEGRWRSGADVVISPTRYREDKLLKLPAATYNFSLTLVAQNYFTYVVDTTGNVTVAPSDMDKATGGPGMLTLITHLVYVDVSNYEGRWRSGVDVVISPTRYRQNWFIHLPAATYNFSLTLVAQNYFTYAVDTTGNVIVDVDDRVLATGGAGTLTLITHPVNVNVSNYEGRWRSGVDVVISPTRYRNNQLIYLPAATYDFSLTNVAQNYFTYVVDTTGNVTVSDSHKAVSGATSLTLITHAVDFDLGGAPGGWLSGDTTPVFSGDQTLCLPPAVYTFSIAGNQFDYVVDNSAAPYLFTVSPNSAVITVGGVNYTVNLSLGPPDGSCFLISQMAWDDLFRAINEAQIDNVGIRIGMLAMVNAAKLAYDSGNTVTAGNILCALLTEVDAQEGVHIDPASADDIRNTAVNVAAGLGIPLPCLSS